MRFMKAAVVLLALAVGPIPSAQAQLLFDSGPTNGTSYRSAGQGASQAIFVSTPTTIGQIGFWLGAPGGADLKFMIWNGDNTSMLFSSVLSVGPTANHTLVLSDPFNFALTSGQTYYFGIVADNTMYLDYNYPESSTSQNGLTMTGPNRNYAGYDNPVPFDNPAVASIGIQLFGTERATVTPEPTSVTLLATGLVGVVGVGVRRRRRR